MANIFLNTFHLTLTYFPAKGLAPGGLCLNINFYKNIKKELGEKKKEKAHIQCCTYSYDLNTLVDR